MKFDKYPVFKIRNQIALVRPICLEPGSAGEPYPNAAKDGSELQ